jgi:hypothetical protein
LQSESEEARDWKIDAKDLLSKLAIEIARKYELDASRKRIVKAIEQKVTWKMARLVENEKIEIKIGDIA